MCQIHRIKSGKFITPFSDSQQASNHCMLNLDFNCSNISLSKQTGLPITLAPLLSNKDTSLHHIISITHTNQNQYACRHHSNVPQKWEQMPIHAPRGIISREVTLADNPTVTNQIHQKSLHVFHFHLNLIKLKS